MQEYALYRLIESIFLKYCLDVLLNPPTSIILSIMWQDNKIHLPNSLWAAYQAELIDLGLMEEARSHVDTNGIHGGQSTHEALQHFCHRFTNSSSRIEYFLLDPEQCFDSASRKTKLSLNRGNLVIIDLAGGAGAGTISLLTTIASLRSSGKEPKLPLNITVYNADFSPDAQTIAQSMHIRIGTHLLETGITIKFESYLWDATDISQTNQLCYDLLSSQEADEYLILISNISGIGREGFSAIEDSIIHIMQRITNKRAFVVWVEPGSNASEWLHRRVGQIANKIKKLAAHFKAFVPVFSYTWTDQIKNTYPKSKISLQQFTRDY